MAERPEIAQLALYNVTRVPHAPTQSTLAVRLVLAAEVRRFTGMPPFGAEVRWGDLRAALAEVSACA
jgi:hypothetical protein